MAYFQVTSFDAVDPVTSVDPIADRFEVVVDAVDAAFERVDTFLDTSKGLRKCAGRAWL